MFCIVFKQKTHFKEGLAFSAIMKMARMLQVCKLLGVIVKLQCTENTIHSKTILLMRSTIPFAFRYPNTLISSWTQVTRHFRLGSVLGTKPMKYEHTCKPSQL